MKYAVVFLCNSFIIIAGCNLLKTREVEPPYDRATTFLPPTSADIVLNNFRRSVIDYKIDNYMKCFVDTSERNYVFVPSSYYGIFYSWDLESERTYMLNLGKPSFTPTLNFIYRDSIITGDSVGYYVDYYLEYPHNINEVSKVRGGMWLYLQKNKQGFWSIYRWEDIRTETDSTWSYLKANI